MPGSLGLLGVSIALSAVFSLSGQEIVAPPVPDGTIITNLSAVRRLSVPEAQRRHAVRVQAVVTYTDAPWSSLFVHDGGAGIWVELAPNQPNPGHGQRVQLNAVTAPGLFAPILTDATLEALGVGSYPNPSAWGGGSICVAGGIDRELVSL